MNKKELKARKQILLAEKEKLENDLCFVNIQLLNINRLEKPYVAEVQAYSGTYSASFATEEAARKKMNEYFGKKYFKNGLNYGVYLYKWNDSLTKTLIEHKVKDEIRFRLPEFKFKEETK